MIPFSIIVALDSKFGIGKNGLLPWHLPQDLKHFKTITTRVSDPEKINAVIMGRKTWESIPFKFRPLPGRLNIVLSRQSALDLPGDVIRMTSLQDALNFLAKKQDAVGEVFVIGGAQIFKEAVNHPACQKIYLTQIEKEFSCDTFFPEVLSEFSEISRKAPVLDQGINLRFSQYIKISRTT